MDSSEAGLDGIEAQRPMVVYHDRLRRRSFPMNLINTFSSRGFSQSGGEDTQPPTVKTEPVAEFFINLRFSDLFDLPGEYVLMNAEMIGELSDGNKGWLEKLRSHGTPTTCFKSNRGDSVLHLVAAQGHLEVVKTIVSECPCLLLEPNWKDQLPLHVAASAGHLAVVESLVATLTFVSAKLSEEEWERLNLYVVKDINGDTPLHSALKGHNMKVASSLVEANRQASFLANKDGISPLYLAVDAGDVSLVKAMLGNDSPEGRKSNLDSQLEGRKDLAHAALELNSTDILDAVLKVYPSLVDELDEEGRTCLSFGASMGNYTGVCNLLDRSTKGVFVCDEDGSFPIHVAVEKGHIKVVKEILKRCPSSKHMLNKQGRNILHIAANCGKYKILHHLRTSEETYHLANEQDVDGNTPLHLATIKWRPKAAGSLQQRNVFIKNNSGLTALDIAESNLQPQYIFRERLTLLVLSLGRVPTDGYLQFVESNVQPHYIFRERLTLLVLSLGRVPRDGKLVKLKGPSILADCDGNKEYINALLLVAALVATVTFAAGFTIPGGFNSSVPKLGMATLASDGRLVAFLIFDIVAMQCSVIAVVSLMWAQLGDPALRRTSLNVALPSLYIALESMSFAFLFGLIISAGNVTGLIVVVCIICCIFLDAMLFILAPHMFLQRHLDKILQKPVARFVLSCCLISFLRFVNDDDDKSDQTSAAHMSAKRAESVEISGNDHVETPQTT